jgi:hypothetical protein
MVQFSTDAKPDFRVEEIALALAAGDSLAGVDLIQRVSISGSSADSPRSETLFPVGEVIDAR